MFGRDSNSLANIVVGLSYNNPNAADGAGTAKCFIMYKTVGCPQYPISIVIAFLSEHIATQKKTVLFGFPCWFWPIECEHMYRMVICRSIPWRQCKQVREGLNILSPTFLYKCPNLSLYFLDTFSLPDMQVIK